MKKLNSKAGFTLIEVLIVVIILASLAVMVAPYLMDLPDRMKSKIVLADMQSMDTALKVYKLENGVYPKDLNDLLVVPPQVTGRTTPYLERDPLDPWSQRYQYRHPGTKSRVGYDLFSSGPNRVPEDGENDDIANWKPSE